MAHSTSCWLYSNGPKCTCGASIDIGPYALTEHDAILASWPMDERLAALKYLVTCMELELRRSANAAVRGHDRDDKHPDADRHLDAGGLDGEPD